MYYFKTGQDLNMVLLILGQGGLSLLLLTNSVASLPNGYSQGGDVITKNMMKRWRSL